MVASWQQEQEKNWQDLVNKAHQHLTKAGLAKEAVANKFKPKYYDVADDIIDEAQAGGYDTVVMGRRGLGHGQSPAPGERHPQGGGQRQGLRRDHRGLILC